MYITGLENTTINIVNDLDEMFAEPGYIIDIYFIADKLSNITDAVFLNFEDMLKEVDLTTSNDLNSNIIDYQESKMHHMKQCIARANCITHYINKHHFHNLSIYNEMFSFLFLISVFIGFYSCFCCKKHVNKHPQIHIVEAEEITPNDKQLMAV